MEVDNITNNGIKNGPGFHGVIKEGFLWKRGEHIKNWRLRYFFLLDDGSLIGFKNRPTHSLNDPLNNFTVKGCQIMVSDKPKPNVFIIRGLLMTSIIERTFSTQTTEERDSWLEAIQKVSTCLGAAETEEFMKNPSPRPRKKMELADFQFLQTLGQGTFGKVILSQEKNTGKLYALKILDKKQIISKDEVAHTLTENQVLQQSNHPFLTQLKYSFQTADKLCFVLECAIGGELYTHLSQERIFSEDRSRFYGAEITSAIGYLHAHDVVYRDLKLENLLLDKEGHIKIADFGLCKQDISFGDKTRTFCGTPEYLAPELIEDEYYGRAVDWWSLGVVMYEMLCGRLPFHSRDHEQLFQMIVSYPVRLPSLLSPPARSLISGLLIKDPEKRLGGGPDDANELMRHAFFASINWDDLVAKKIPPPFKPYVASETDTRHFDTKFTRLPVSMTPPGSIRAAGSTLSSINEDPDEQPYFQRFSYQDTSSLVVAASASNNGGDHDMTASQNDISHSPLDF